MTLSLDATDEPCDADCATILQGLIEHNAPFLGPRDHRRLAVFARRDGRVIGGLIGETARGLFRIELLWVRPQERGAGIGAKLMAAAEAEARARSCRQATLDTFDFQARPFYERLGYSVFGALEGYPNGHRCFFMSKPL